MKKRYRLHGSRPYTVIAIHGGPGAIGEARPFAMEIAAAGRGVVEPFLLAETFDGQVAELKEEIERYADGPVILAGHSYGALLSFVFAARYPSLVTKLIMLSTPVMEAKDTAQVDALRHARLSAEEAENLATARQTYKQSEGIAKAQAFRALLELIKQADGYKLAPHNSDLLPASPDLYDSAWEGMRSLRDSGELVAMGADIQCPVVAIHGDYDPRPAAAIKASLNKHVKDLQFVLLEKCGHYPWYEQYTRAPFYRELERHIGYTSDNHVRESRLV
jgi:pimeloyl-ACP methyl ester carboxylesterase